MNQLWAPWRLEAVKSDPHTEYGGCIFCLFPAESGEAADAKNLILGRSAHSFAILNKFPYNNGHLMVIPRRHTAEFEKLPDAEFQDLHRLLQQALGILRAVYAPQGFNVGMNLGQIAGAGIADHLHYHLVPRWNGDTNFMPVLGETKVMIEHLASSYQKLRAAFDRALIG